MGHVILDFLLAYEHISPLSKLHLTLRYTGLFKIGEI